MNVWAAVLGVATLARWVAVAASLISIACYTALVIRAACDVHFTP